MSNIVVIAAYLTLSLGILLYENNVAHVKISNKLWLPCIFV